MNQLSFLYAPPRQRHSATSTEAAESLRETDCERARQKILQYCRLNYGATDQELQLAFGWSGDFERPRRVELVRDKLLVDSGMTRKTTKGRNAAVWIEP